MLISDCLCVSVFYCTLYMFEYIESNILDHYGNIHIEIFHLLKNFSFSKFFNRIILVNIHYNHIQMLQEISLSYIFRKWCFNCTVYWYSCTKLFDSLNSCMTWIILLIVFHWSHYLTVVMHPILNNSRFNLKFMKSLSKNLLVNNVRPISYSSNVNLTNVFHKYWWWSITYYHSFNYWN